MHALSVQAIHPSRTVGARHSLQTTASSANSQGELFWGRGANRKLSYALDLQAESRRASQSYEGKVKLGLMMRALQLEGHVTSSPTARAMDAAFHWDADRDQQKQVALKTRWTSGRKNTADITLGLPSINQVRKRQP